MSVQHVYWEHQSNLRAEKIFLGNTKRSLRWRTYGKQFYFTVPREDFKHIGKPLNKTLEQSEKACFKGSKYILN